MSPITSPTGATSAARLSSDESPQQPGLSRPAPQDSGGPRSNALRRIADSTRRLKTKLSSGLLGKDAASTPPTPLPAAPKTLPTVTTGAAPIATGSTTRPPAVEVDPAIGTLVTRMQAGTSIARLREEGTSEEAILAAIRARGAAASGSTSTGPVARQRTTEADLRTARIDGVIALMQGDVEERTLRNAGIPDDIIREATTGRPVAKRSADSPDASSF